MINRQAMRGAGPKTAGKAPPHTKPTKGEGGRASVKTNGASSGAGTGPDSGGWRGEEVLSASSAEEAASRAEGNSPVPAEFAAGDDHGTYLEKGPARRPRADDPDAVENTEEKRQSAAEEHAGRSSRHFPYGKL